MPSLAPAGQPVTSTDNALVFVAALENWTSLEIQKSLRDGPGTNRADAACAASQIS